MNLLLLAAGVLGLGVFVLVREITPKTYKSTKALPDETGFIATQKEAWHEQKELNDDNRLTKEEEQLALDDLKRSRRHMNKALKKAAAEEEEETKKAEKSAALASKGAEKDAVVASAKKVFELAGVPGGSVTRTTDKYGSQHVEISGDGITARGCPAGSYRFLYDDDPICHAPSGRVHDKAWCAQRRNTLSMIEQGYRGKMRSSETYYLPPGSLACAAHDAQ